VAAVRRGGGNRLADVTPSELTDGVCIFSLVPVRRWDGLDHGLPVKMGRRSTTGALDVKARESALVGWSADDWATNAGDRSRVTSSQLCWRRRRPQAHRRHLRRRCPCSVPDRRHPQRCHLRRRTNRMSRPGLPCRRMDAALRSPLHGWTPYALGPAFLQLSNPTGRDRRSSQADGRTRSLPSTGMGAGCAHDARFSRRKLFTVPFRRI
jgi:hypothetical protein